MAAITCRSLLSLLVALLFLTSVTQGQPVVAPPPPLPLLPPQAQLPPGAVPTPPAPEIFCAGLSITECLQRYKDSFDLLFVTLTPEQIQQLFSSIGSAITADFGYSYQGSYNADPQVQRSILDVFDDIEARSIAQLSRNGTSCEGVDVFETTDISIRLELVDVSILGPEGLTIETPNGAEFTVETKFLQDIATKTSDGKSCIAFSLMVMSNFPLGPEFCPTQCGLCDEQLTGSDLHSFTFHDVATGDDYFFKGTVQYEIPIVDEEIVRTLREQDEEDGASTSSSSSGCDNGSGDSSGSGGGGSGGSGSGSGSGGNSIIVPICTFLDMKTGCFSDEGCKQVGIVFHDDDYTDDESAQSETGGGGGGGAGRVTVQCKCTHLTDFSVMFVNGDGGGGGGGGSCRGGTSGEQEEFDASDPIFISSVLVFVATIIAILVVCAIYHRVKSRRLQREKSRVRRVIRAANGSNESASNGAKREQGGSGSGSVQDAPSGRSGYSTSKV